MITIETIGSSLSASGLSRFLGRARKAVGLSGEVDVLLADDATLKRLNRDFRGKNKATDVLSFPSPDEIAAVHAGALAISLDTAARQAKTYGHTLRDEVRILLLHGLLHLSGLDHETDDGEMAARESELRRELRLGNTLIARVETPIRHLNSATKTTTKTTAKVAAKPAAKARKTVAAKKGIKTVKDVNRSSRNAATKSSMAKARTTKPRAIKSTKRRTA